MSDVDSYDVVVLGSGFGGSLIATILAKAGRRVAMIDRQRHPRFTIGESSTPTADVILHDLAVRYDLPELLPLTRYGDWRETYPQFLCGSKRGFTYFWHGDDDGLQLTPDHRHELFVTANASETVADTHWYRPDVDHFFATIAKTYAVDLFEETEIIKIEHPKPNQWFFHLAPEDDSSHLQSKFVIDASGIAGIIPRLLGLQRIENSLRTNSFAVYSHFENVSPYENPLRSSGAYAEDYPFPVDQSAIHHLFRNGWSYQLRFANGLTSLGSLFFDPQETPSSLSPEQLLTYHRPALAEVLAGAEVASVPGRIIQTDRLQRLWASGAGDDWTALPFTTGFIDPLHSTGIAHTLSGIERLAEILLQKDPSDRQLQLNTYSDEIIQELRLIDLMIAGCYLGLANFRLFTTWSMVYFAAATSYEKIRSDAMEAPSGFLLANNTNFVSTVQSLHHELEEFTRQNSFPNSKVDEFEGKVRQALVPFNHVRLFEPETPNMYTYTAADK